jgi:hypothetical protein
MIKTIFWAFVLLLALSFFGISIRSIIMSPAGQENFGFVAYWLAFAWNWVAGYIHTLAKAFS